MALTLKQLYNLGLEERLREYKQQDLSAIQKRVAELQKMRFELVKQNTILNAQKVKSGANIKTAIEQQNKQIEVALINYAADTDSARTEAQSRAIAARMAPSVKLFGEAVGATQKTTAVVNAARVALEEDKGKITGSIRESVALADTDQTTESLLTLEDGGWLMTAIGARTEEYNEKLVGLGPAERYKARIDLQTDLETELVRMVIEHGKNKKGEVVLDPQISRQIINQTLKQQRVFNPTSADNAAEKRVYEGNLPDARDKLERAFNEIDPGRNHSSIINDMVNKVSSPSKTIKEYIEGLDNIPMDKAVKDQLKIFDDDIKELKAPIQTEFGKFIELYRDHPNKDTLNKIIGAESDKTGAYIYHHNKDALQTALSGIQTTKLDLEDPQMIIALRKQIANDLGLITLGNVNPIRLRQAMARRAPLELPKIKRTDEPPEDLQSVPKEQQSEEDKSIGSDIAQSLADEFDEEIQIDSVTAARKAKEAAEAERARQDAGIDGMEPTELSNMQRQQQAEVRAVEAAEGALGVSSPVSVEERTKQLVDDGISPEIARNMANLEVRTGQSSVSPDEVGRGGTSDQGLSLDERGARDKEEGEAARDVRNLIDQRVALEKKVDSIKAELDVDLVKKYNISTKEEKAKTPGYRPGFMPTEIALTNEENKEKKEFFEQQLSKNLKGIEAESRMIPADSKYAASKPSLVNPKTRQIIRNPAASLLDHNQINDAYEKTLREYETKFPTGTSYPTSSPPPVKKTTPFSEGESQQPGESQQAFRPTVIAEDTPVLMTDVMERIKAQNKKKPSPNQQLAEMFTGGTN